MSNNIFSWRRFDMLFKQHFIHNSQFLFLSTVAYAGVIFIVLSILQVGDDLHPHDSQTFQGFFAVFVTVFGILYVGHSFPAFRSKEATISYLLIPASALEKFAFEFVSRIVLTVLTLPLLFWVTFHLQGYLFAMFTQEAFESVGIEYLVKIDNDVPSLIYALLAGAIMFALSLAFAGAATFSKQPLVKSLFAVALIVAFFVFYSYIIVVQLGVGQYNPPETMVLLPIEEKPLLRFISIACFAGAAVMLFVAYLKLKEREV